MKKKILPEKKPIDHVIGGPLDLTGVTDVVLLGYHDRVALVRKKPMERGILDHNTGRVWLRH